VTVIPEGLPLGLRATGNPNYTTQFGGGHAPTSWLVAGRAHQAGGTSIRSSEWFNTACRITADFTFGNESRTDANLSGRLA